MLAAAKIPALLLIFTAKSHDSREADWWRRGGVQTDSKGSGEKEKRLPETERARRRRKKSGIESVPF